VQLWHCEYDVHAWPVSSDPHVAVVVCFVGDGLGERDGIFEWDGVVDGTIADTFVGDGLWLAALDGDGVWLATAACVGEADGECVGDGVWLATATTAGEGDGETARGVHCIDSTNEPATVLKPSTDSM
jgi:hypothetical protein